MSLGLRTVILTFLALLAFASNSLLTRLALGAHEIDPATFTSIRLIAGAVVLAAIVGVRARSLAPLRWAGAREPMALFMYAAPFTFAYVRVGAAAGALVLFGTVQLTMLGYGIFRGERPSAATWLGIVLAVMGFAILTVPSATRPDLLGLALMVVAGSSWAVYSLAGRTAVDPLAANARSFFWSSPLALVLTLVLPATTDGASEKGIALAVISGAITSGLGYAIWYRALPRLSVTQAAVAQLSVPVIAALGAGLFLQEILTARFVLATATILGGVALVLSARSRTPSAHRR